MPSTSTPIAERIAASLRAGTVLDLIPDVPVDRELDEDAMRAWGADHDVDADVLRDLLRCLDPELRPDPRGLRLRGLRVRGRLDLNLVTTPVSLELEDCLLEEGISADQAHLPTLFLSRCWIAHPTQIVLDFDRLRVDGSLYLNRSVIIGATWEGAVRLADARIGGSLYLRSTTVRNPDGPAVVTAGAHIERDLVADGTCIIDGGNEWGALVLQDARIGGAVFAPGATIRNPAGPALHGGGLQVGKDLYLNEGFTAKGSGDRATVHLSGARIGGRLRLEGGRVDHDEARYRWSLDGLTYSGVPMLDAHRNRDAWIALLRTETPRYAAQPYQQLAATYRAEGHDGDVRAILMSQRRDQLARGDLTGADRWWARLTGLILGYGYQPWRALLYLAAALATSVALSLGLGAQGALERGGGAGAVPRPCTLIETVGRGLDLGTPFLPRAASTGCEVTTSAAGMALAIATWILQVLAWALAALFVAGFTGIVRKS
jgi:hypothetical protein